MCARVGVSHHYPCATHTERTERPLFLWIGCEQRKTNCEQSRNWQILWLQHRPRCCTMGLQENRSQECGSLGTIQRTSCQSLGMQKKYNSTKAQTAQPARAAPPMSAVYAIRTREGRDLSHEEYACHRRRRFYRV